MHNLRFNDDNPNIPLAICDVDGNLVHADTKLILINPKTGKREEVLAHEWDQHPERFS